MKVFGLILILAVNSVKCYKNKTSLRIYSGYHMSIALYPYAVFLFFEHTVPSSCGGSLITWQTVLTAAHCVDELRVRKGRIWAYFGSDVPNDAKVIRKVHSYEINPRYNQKRGVCNLAVVFWKSPVPRRNGIQKIPLTREEPFINQRAFAVGWGKQNVFQSPPKLPDKPKWRALRATKQRIVDKWECAKFANYQVLPQSLCSVPKIGHFYMDDSGAGLIVKNPLRLVAVLSFVANGASIYTGVASFREWIVKAIKKLKKAYYNPHPKPLSYPKKTIGVIIRDKQHLKLAKKN